MSIPANIVEGRCQKSERDFARFLGYALNSSTELEYHLIVARDFRAITLSDFNSLHAQTNRSPKDASRPPATDLQSKARTFRH